MSASFYPLDARVWGMLQQKMLKNTNRKVFLKHLRKNMEDRKQSLNANNADNADSFYKVLNPYQPRYPRLKKRHANLLLSISTP